MATIDITEKTLAETLETNDIVLDRLLGGLVRPLPHVRPHL